MLQLHMKSIQKCVTHLHASTLLHFLHALAREMASEGTEMAPEGTEMDPVGTEMDPWEALRASHCYPKQPWNASRCFQKTFWKLTRRSYIAQDVAGWSTELYNRQNALCGYSGTL